MVPPVQIGVKLLGWPAHRATQRDFLWRISLGRRVPTRARGIQGKVAGMGKSGRKGRDRGCMDIEKGRSRGSRIDMCANSARTYVFMCDGRVESGSESGARTGANWSRLVCPISVPSTPPLFVPHPARLLDRSINPSRCRIPPSCSVSISPTS